MWINAPFTQLTAFVQHYMHCKQRSPDGTSACILVPGYLLPVLKPLLSGMRLLKKFTKGAAIFEQSSRSGCSSTSPGINWPVYIYSDAPIAVGKAFADGRPLHGLHGATVATAAGCPDLSSDGRLSMLFEGSFGGDFDLILGNTVMSSQRAVLDYSNFTASFCRDGKLYTVTPSSVLGGGASEAFDGQLPDAEFRQHGVSKSLPFEIEVCQHVDSSEQNAAFSAVLGDSNPRHFLSCAQARRSIKRGCRAFLTLVTEVDIADATLADKPLFWVVVLVKRLMASCLMLNLDSMVFQSLCLLKMRFVSMWIHLNRMQRFLPF